MGSLSTFLWKINVLVPVPGEPTPMAANCDSSAVDWVFFLFSGEQSIFPPWQLLNVAEADCRYEKINYENYANQHEAHEAKKNDERKRLEKLFP